MEFLEYSYNTKREVTIPFSNSLKNAIENSVFNQLIEDFGEIVRNINITLCFFSKYHYDMPLGYLDQIGLSKHFGFEISFYKIGTFRCNLLIKNTSTPPTYIVNIKDELSEPDKVEIWIEYTDEDSVKNIKEKIQDLDASSYFSDGNISLKDYQYLHQDGYSLNVSKSLKDIIKKGIFKQLIAEFGHGVNKNSLYFAFESINEDQPLLATNIDGLSFSPFFKIGYSSPYVFLATLYLKVINGEKMILNVEEEIADPEGVMVYYEMDEVTRASLSERINQVNLWKKVNIISDYRFPVKVISGGIDSKIKLKFSEILSIEEKKMFFESLENKRAYYNEVEHEDHLGIIHNMSVEKGLSRKGDNMTLSVDLGSAGEPGLRYILKLMHDSSVPIELVEIR